MKREKIKEERKTKRNKCRNEQRMKKQVKI